MEQKKEKVLLFSSREICYSSGNFFAHQLAGAFEELGFEAKICEMAADDDLDAKLEPLLEEEYRLAVDFNSMLPRMEMDNGVAYLDCLKAPFFDYILDHPLFHYTGLNRGVKNLNVIVLDEEQGAYVRTYYSDVEHVYVLPLGATKALYEGEKEKECRILFPGTYDTPEAVYEVVKASPEPLQSLMKHLIEMRLANPLIPMEVAFAELLHQMDMELDTTEFALYMNAMYAVDAYVRDYFRKATLDELLKEKIPVSVIGNGWEKYSYRDEHSLKRERQVPFGLSFERMAKAHILLDVSPIFNRGMHDRIPAGMANRCVVLTDENPYLKEWFAHEQELSFYSLERGSSIVESAEHLMTQPSLRQEIAERGYRAFEAGHTWIHRAKQILAYADSLI